MKTYLIILISSLAYFTGTGYAEGRIPPNDTIINGNQNQNYNYNSPNNNPNSQGYNNPNTQGWKDSIRMTPGNANSTSGNANSTSGKMMKDQSYYLQNGKVYQYTGGKLKMVDKTVTFKNGTTISPEGMVKMKNGKSQQLQTNQGMDINGSIAPYKP